MELQRNDQQLWSDFLPDVEEKKDKGTMKPLVPNNQQLWNNFLLEMRMGQCSICGYNKCQGAIEFHRIRGRKGGVDVNILVKKVFNAENVFIFMEETIMSEEADRSIAVCVNCHREIHSKK